MKIPTSGIEIDTDKLSDKDAEIHEALKNLFDVCVKYDTTVFTRVILNKTKYIGAQTVPLDKDKLKLDYKFLMNILADWVEKTTEGKLMVVSAEDFEE